MITITIGHGDLEDFESLHHKIKMHKSLSQYKVVFLLDLSIVASKPIQIIECTLNFTSRMDHVKQLQLETSIFFLSCLKE